MRREKLPPPLAESIGIEASRARVWDLVRDVRRMAEWSPQVDSTRMHDDRTAPELGARFVNLNSHGELRWTTHGTIVRFTPEQELAFRIEENWAIWSFQLQPTGSGTLLTQHRETPDGISPYSLDLTDQYMGGQTAFTELMRAGMRQTLERIKVAAEPG